MSLSRDVGWNNGATVGFIGARLQRCGATSSTYLLSRIITLN
jgi:hypothetical protein